MKTKFITLIVCMLVCIFTTFTTMAQQPHYTEPGNSAKQRPGGNVSASYTYHVFEAPNKMFGYDIFLNGKIIFHQPASIVQPGISVAVLAKKAHAEKAAPIVIEKIKRGESPVLAEEEIKKIIVQ